MSDDKPHFLDTKNGTLLTHEEWKKRRETSLAMLNLMDEFLTDEERKKRRETSLAMLDLMLNSDVDLNHLPKDAIKFWTDEDK